MAQDGGIGNVKSVWRVGTLSAAELEKLAGEIRPSWEIGLDAARDGEALAAMGPVDSAGVPVSAEGFRVGDAALMAEMSALAHNAPLIDPSSEPATVSTPLPVMTGDVGPAAVSVRPAARSAPSVRPQPVAPPRRSTPAPVVRAGHDDAVGLPRTKTSRTTLFALAGVAVLVIVGGAMLAVHDSPSAPTERVVESAAPAQSGPSAPAPAAAATPAPAVALAAPVPAVVVAPAVAPPAPVVPPPVPAPTAVAPVVVAPAPVLPVDPPAPVHPVPHAVVASSTHDHHASHPSHPPSTGGARGGMLHRRHPGGAGFVTESPY